MNAQDYIRSLNLSPHVEGGHFRELFVSGEKDAAGRALYSSILFLLEKDEVSRLHRLLHDEVWYYHAGGTLNIYMIAADGRLTIEKLGPDPEKGERLQVTVPGGTVFGAALCSGTYALCGCMCAPAFLYEEFEIPEKDALLKAYPQYAYVIKRLAAPEAG